MKARPILFSGPMVRALLAGTKTQTRRVVKPMGGLQSAWLDAARLAEVPRGQVMTAECGFGWQMEHPKGGPGGWIRSPYGRPGDLLWVRETWRPVHSGDPSRGATYLADKPVGWRDQTVWKPGIHMFRWASRLTLEITEVRVERLRNCSEADAAAEGVQDPSLVPILGAFWSSRDGYARLWDHINGAGRWDANPWVWAVSFKAHQQNVDAILAVRP